MSDSPKQVIKRFIGFSMGPIISAFINFFSVSLTTYFIIPEETGRAAMYTMVLSVSSLLIFLGLDQAFTREFNAAKDKKNLFINAAIIPLIVSIVVGIIGMLFYNKISLMIFGLEDKLIIILLALALPLTVIERFNLLLIRMQEKARLYSFLNVMTKLINIVVLIPYLLYVDRSFKAIIVISFVTLLSMCIVEFIFTKDYWLYKLNIDKKLLEKMFRYGAPLIPATVIVSILNSMDKVAMQRWSTYAEIGLYNNAMKIVGLVSIVQGAFCTFWTPTAFKWYEDRVEGERFIKVSNLVMCFMTFMFTGIVLFKDIIIKLFSSNYAASAEIIPFLLLLPVMYTVSEATCLGIAFSGKTYFNILVSSVAAIVNLLFNYFLVPKYGAVGAAIATGVSYIVFFWMRTIISRSLWFKFKLNFYILNTLAMTLLATVTVVYNNIYLNLIITILIIYINRKETFTIINYIKGFLKKQ